MDMRATEDIAVGEDITPPLPPIAAALHDSSVTSYCSACFSTLPPHPFPPSTPTFPQNSHHVPAPLYCSPACGSIDSSLHFSSAESHLLSLFNQSPPATWTDSSDLRLSLRLVHIFQTLPTKYSSDVDRIWGLMTNREKLLFGESVNNQFQQNRPDCDVLGRIREGAKMMAQARGMCVNGDKNGDFVLEEMVLCLVMTNAVEVVNKSGSSIGIAVYDAAFSWINHSCSPNACYRFVEGIDHNEQGPFRIAPPQANGLNCHFSERNGYGPRVIVRSIKGVNKGEEVTITYTDLLQPREMRQAELWLKYRFICSCKRCAAVPTTYVDFALQALSADNPDLDNKIEKLTESFDDAVNDYLSFGDPKSCCTKLENLLNHNNLIDNFLEPKEGKSPQKVKLHLCHHLSLNADTILASAFRVQASDLLALNNEIEEHEIEAFNMLKISCAYSLLLAGVVNHLFMFESSLVMSVANFWINAGESLLNLVRSPTWDPFLKRGLMHFEISPFSNLKCNDCRLVDTLEPIFRAPYQKLQLEEIKSRLYNCIANITPKVWRILASESHFLKSIQNPIDISLLASPVIPNVESSQFETEDFVDQLRTNLILLSIHCLRNRNSSSKRLPPGSLGLPVIGQSLEVLKAMRNNKGEEWLRERAQKYGPISKLHIFGTPSVFLQGQANNKFIYTSDENTLSSKQPSSIRRLLGERNLFEVNSEDHDRLRRAFLSFLKPEALKQSVAKMDEEIRLHLDQHWHQNQEILVMPLMKTLTFNVICTILFGIERGERRDKLVFLFQQVMIGMLAVPINLPFTRFNISLRARVKAEEIIRELIHEKREKLGKHDLPNHQDLITSLLSMRDETDSPLLTDEEIVDNCVVAMIAGHDTTSILLTFLIKLLSENPQVYDIVLKEQEEIARGKVSGEHLTWDDLVKMKYTWRVATEALRMYPPVFFTFRQVLKDIEMGGYIIPKGWQVLWAGCTTHMDESIFPDPHKFNPSRYEKSGAIPPHTFVAFGGGSRTCPGNEFARIETLSMIHYLVTGFRWKLCLEENVMSRDPMPVFKQGLPILIERRTSMKAV